MTLATDDGNVSSSVSWDVESCTYDPNLTTAQTFTVGGTVTLPSGVVNTNNVSLDTSISVTVNAAVSTDKTLTSVTAPDAITGLTNRTAKTAAALGLPSTVTLATDSGTVSASVSWDVASSSYDASLTTAQTFTVSGTVTLPGGVVNTNNVSLTTNISVTVNAAVSTDKTLISVTAPAAINGITNGTAKTASALGLPSTVTLVTGRANRVYQKLCWHMNYVNKELDKKRAWRKQVYIVY